MRGDYYNDKLSAGRLKQAYDIAPPRVKQYLEAEVDHVAGYIMSGDRVLELGCGYGRILPRLAEKASCVIGIDTSLTSLFMGRELLRDTPNCFLLRMDAIRLGFSDGVFDRVVCIQNGISAFHVSQRELIGESIRVAKPAATILFSSYSERFWEHRLEWFRLQSEAGLLGEIDHEKTGNGVIICKDGFKATTVNPERFVSIVTGFNVDFQIIEVDESSIFCEITPEKKTASSTA